ncbi:MAG TPA: dipeptidase [Planctomycetota bacterium]|nr:dipeptidase [Planctomycetota bacterium]
MHPLADISEAAAALHRRALVMDAHADTLTEMTDRGYDLDAAPEGRHLDLPRCAGGVLDAQVFTCFVHPQYVGHGAADRARAMLDTLDRQLARFPDRLALCTAPGDVAAARAAGQLGAVLAVEGGHAIENDLRVLEEFFRRGVRTMTLTWNNSNEWADGCGDAGLHGGLTARGREVVSAMDSLGMVVDISHVAPTTFRDALEVARRPCIASHSCARALRDHPRNLTDEQLRALAQRGGVACLNVYPVFLVAEGEATLEHVLDHAERFLRVAGEDHVGLGCDYDGIGVTPVDMPDVAALPRLTDGLLRRGWSERAVEKMLGANLLRVFEECLPARAPRAATAGAAAASAAAPAAGAAS